MSRRLQRNVARRRRWLALAVIAALVLWWASHRTADTNQPYLSNDVEALARVIRSEIGVGTRKQKIHIAWAARNLAKDEGIALAKLVCWPCGRQGRGRPLSTRQPATEADRSIARKVLTSRQARDPTGGATHFINPQLQDRLAKNGKRPGYRGNTYRRVAKRWKKSYGWQPYYRIGSNLELWGPKRRKRNRRLSKKRSRLTQ